MLKYYEEVFNIMHSTFHSINNDIQDFKKIKQD